MKMFLRLQLADFRPIGMVAAFLASAIAAFSQSDYSTNKIAAEKFYADGSYAKANEIYSKVDVSSLSPDDARWVDFRLADTQWRSAAATDNPDTTKLDEARDRLEKQIRNLTRDDQHDRIWAEVEESLGDFFWTRRSNYNWYNDWSSAWTHYQAALDWWAGQNDLDLARERYLKIVWRVSQ